ncbi:hypothetical protein METBIDRAFT_10204 [Metschnikowia bicuspidata var. bicuspidata NRRL YB-4993]|uniref:Uncharacterized protein n=1 Tax=Metschnikowia bicuspidata var. bicuspidata NRRL YB-4993 TaxID=869754 RepID=A0A1A0HJ33_9ASCO|nr:hypothetical protein METBIDRAFT_10204 [Metschnikowia bicuspidata var. bicuspidata NRRL YB-4993]OBA24011.1 hypothetical protein METBIDRAFT_10204 [Metschnikowia bicuspidata var. bicuspidata NRRL YB-4993]
MKLLATLPLLSLVLALPGPSLPLSGFLSIKKSGDPAQVGTGYISINDDKVVKSDTSYKFDSEKGLVFLYRLGRGPNKLFMGLDEQKKLALTEQEPVVHIITKDAHEHVLSVGGNFKFELCDDGLIGQNSGCTFREDIEIKWTPYLSR